MQAKKNSSFELSWWHCAKVGHTCREQNLNDFNLPFFSKGCSVLSEGLRELCHHSHLAVWQMLGWDLACLLLYDCTFPQLFLAFERSFPLFPAFLWMSLSGTEVRSCTVGVGLKYWDNRKKYFAQRRMTLITHKDESRL